MESIIVAIISVVGVGVGALLQNRFSRSANTAKAFTDTRNEACADYLRAVAAAATSGDKTAAIHAATDAKTRISVYGSNAVLKALAESDKAGLNFQDDAARDGFINIIQTMRKETQPGDFELDSNIVHAVLFSSNKK